MVKYVFLLNFMFICSFYCYSQKNMTDTAKIEIIDALESWPIYKGGVESLSRFVEEKICYPKTAIKDSLEGIVYILMDVNLDGSTSNHAIIKGIRDDLDNEALRIAKLIKFEKPAMQQGLPIKVKYVLPIRFQLSKKHVACKRNK